ncbi:uncharacterized protein LOC119284332 [Triticum dicoccoides]|uniref:uncharacterized protein LOC119284332 n=1 Tax=Triticum dicoccoides TaxID=85692 RepID=UPI00188E3C19|nr:uncharacterized protein LOC119284332 [Triticum dicoccoides]
MEGAERGGNFERNTKSRLETHLRATTEAAGLFTDDLILEILSCLPARSLHRFKCVSVSWRDLIADPSNRKKLRQTLAGFLYFTSDDSGDRHHFASVSGGAAPFDPSLPCLQPTKYKYMAQVDACNGLLLYRGSNKKMMAYWNWNWAEDDFHFVVCNPVTGRWVELPPSPQAPENRFSCTAGLAFDPAVSSNFYILHSEQIFVGCYITGVNIYSSRTGSWTRRDSGMVEKVSLCFFSKYVFVCGIMYTVGSLKHKHEYVLLGVDMEGKVWKTIRVPNGPRIGAIGLSQGCLHYSVDSVVPIDDNNECLDSEITLWYLKDHDSKELVLKHTANTDKLMSMTGKKYRVVEIHPHCDTIFLVSCGGDTLVEYDMQHQKVGCILKLEKDSIQKFLPYVCAASDAPTSLI